MRSDQNPIRTAAELLRARIEKRRGSRDLREEDTKAALIVPLLKALGWNPEDPEEVHYEYCRRRGDNPVDFALKMRNEPVVFIEAKALGADLTDRKATNQLISYSTQAGVAWCVLTNGCDYHIYNASAVVPLEGKLLRKLSALETPVDEFVKWVSLLSKPALQGKRIDQVWKSHRVDAQVRQVLEREMSPESPGKKIVQLIVAGADGLGAKDAEASLRRARVRIEYPPMPIESDEGRPRAERGESRPSQGARVKAAGERPELAVLMDAGKITAPVEIFANYLGKRLTAKITRAGTIELDGTEHTSPSAAGAAARKPFFPGKLKGKLGPATNGWEFWHVEDNGGDVTLDTFVRSRQ